VLSSFHNAVPLPESVIVIVRCETPEAGGAATSKTAAHAQIAARWMLSRTRVS
jgi:hypothetical protein